MSRQIETDITRLTRESVERFASFRYRGPRHAGPFASLEDSPSADQVGEIVPNAPAEVLARTSPYRFAWIKADTIPASPIGRLASNLARVQLGR